MIEDDLIWQTFTHIYSFSAMHRENVLLEGYCKLNKYWSIYDELSYIESKQLVKNHIQIEIYDIYPTVSSHPLQGWYTPHLQNQALPTDRILQSHFPPNVLKKLFKWMEDKLLTFLRIIFLNFIKSPETDWGPPPSSILDLKFTQNILKLILSIGSMFGSPEKVHESSTTR